MRVVLATVTLTFLSVLLRILFSYLMDVLEVPLELRFGDAVCQPFRLHIPDHFSSVERHLLIPFSLGSFHKGKVLSFVPKDPVIHVVSRLAAPPIGPLTMVSTVQFQH